MKNIEDIEFAPLSTDKSGCAGCRILELNKAFHSWMDYEDLKESDVLIVSDSVKIDFSRDRAVIMPDQLKMLKENITFKNYAITASVKCPNIKEADMKPADMNICRKHLSATVDKVKPKLIIALGNLALKMLTKKSGITDKRGQSFPYTSETGFKSIVVPTYHPYAVMLEPRHLALFRQDIRIAYDKIVLGITTKNTDNYVLVKSIPQLREFDWLCSTDKLIAIDTETTGLDFRKDKVLTISIAWDVGKAICIPLFHKESWIISEKELEDVLDFLKRMLLNPNNYKVFHKASFDVKMLYKTLKIIPVNIRDTKILAHQVDEISPNGLADLVKKFFPETLVTL